MLSMELSRPTNHNTGLKKRPRRSAVLMALVISGAFLFGLSGCGSSEPETKSEPLQQSPVLAYVNEEAITQADVDFTLERMLKGQALAQVDDALRKKVLDSLISSRAMKIQMASTLGAEEKESIAQSAKAYEEELYVKEYLANHVVPEPVTLEMIQAYYDKHPEEFGGEAVRDFQLLIMTNAKDLQARDKFLAAVPEIKAAKDWATAKHQLAQIPGVEYREGRTRPGLLEPALEQAISNMEAEQSSDLVHINDQIYLVKVTAVTRQAPRPLTDVSADIRKQLAAQQLRAAVKKASEEVLKNVQVKMSEGENH